MGPPPIESVDYTERNEQEIIDYLTANDLVAQKSDTGLYYIIENQGDGKRATETSNVTVVYKGYFLHGSVFDESNENGLSINLQEVISGFREGITYFNEGGNGVLFIPAHLGYGDRPPGGIPDGFVLVFDIKLVSVD